MLIPAILIALAVGVALKFGFDRLQASSRYSGKVYSITWAEYLVGAVICCLIVAPAVVHFGKNVALGDSVGGFKEYWNGYETGTRWDKTTCHRDGSCRHEYDCDPYPVQVTDYDSEGKPSGSHTEIHYHRCPYTDEEWTFIVATSLGDYTIASHVLPTDPDSHRYRSDHAIKAELAATAGIPAFWAEAKHRVDSGNPGPVTQVNEYDNLILASQSSILKKFSDEIEQLQEDRLLPRPTSGVSDFYKADKVYVIGRPGIGDEAPWKIDVSRFNAALGTTLQGDLHLLLVDANKIPNPDTWFEALQAYWQSPELGKNAISKNAIILALGSKDGQMIDWSRAATGMPVGNEPMLVDLRNELQGQTLEPDFLLGPPRASLIKGEPQVEVGNGLVASIILAGPDKFSRVCMNCDDAGENSASSFDYLKSEVPLTGAQEFWIAFFTAFASLFIWGAFIALDNRFGEAVTGALRSAWNSSKDKRDSDPEQ